VTRRGGVRARRSAWALPCVTALCAWPTAARADVQDCTDAAVEGQNMRDTGAYRRARERFIACAAEQCPGEVRKRCVAWLAEVEQLTPTVVFGARADGKEVADVRVIVDGEPVAERVDGKPVALDPGEHHFRFERAGQAPVEVTAVLRAGEKERLVEARFGPEPSPAQPPAPTPPPPASSLAPRVAEQAAAPAPQPERRPPSGAVYLLGGLAVASLAAGAVLDVSGFVFLQQCNADPSCTGSHERAEVSWRFVTGDVLLGAGVLSGVAAWFVWSRATRVSAARRPAVALGASPGGASVGVKMAF